MLLKKRTITIGGATLFILLAGIGLVYWKANDYISGQLSKHIQKASYQQYSLVMDDLAISLFPLGLTATGVRFSSPDSVFLKTKSGYILPSVKVKVLKAAKINLFSMLFQKGLQVCRFEITDPEVSIISASEPAAP